MITRIAVAEPPGIEVEYACEECDEEREAVVAHEVVVEVAANLLGRGHRGVEFQFRA